MNKYQKFILDKTLCFVSKDMTAGSKAYFNSFINNDGEFEVKQDEIGIIESAKYFQVPLNIYSLEEVGKIDHMFEGSDFVKKTIGVYSVSEPVAYIMGKNMISRKSKHNGITISISKTKGE